MGWFPLGTRKQESRPFAAPTPPTPNRKGAGLKAGPAPPLPQASPPPAPAPLTPPFPGSASGPSHGCPPTLHPPPGAPVGDPIAALHLPPSPAAPVGDPTAALAPSPSQAGPLYRRPSGRAVNPMNCWVAVAGSSPFLPLVPPTHNTGNRKYSIGSCTTRNCILPACITYLPTSAIGYIVLLPVLYLRDPSPTAPHSTSAGTSTHRT